MPVDDALARGRAAIEALMVDTCTIRRATGEVTTDPVTAQVTTAYEVIYEGKCRVQQRTESSAQPADVGEAHLLLVRLELQVPVSVIGVEPEDQVAMTTYRDADLVGRTFIVRDLAHKTHLTSRRLGVVEQTS